MLIPKLPKSQNSMQVLEFKYLMEDGTGQPWLFEIDSDLGFREGFEEDGIGETGKKGTKDI